jgi:hypothetical protein
MIEDPKPPLLVSPASADPAERAGTRSLSLAFTAGAVAALVGGLVWAGVVISLKYDIGILAWFVGAATGLTVHRVAGGSVGGFERALAGLFAAAGIIVGKYVIFVHAVRAAASALLPGRPIPDGYLDSTQMSYFVNHFGSIVRPIYWLWFLLAFAAAFRTSGGRPIWGRGRSRI